MKLSKNFSKAELCKSQTATRMGLNNNPTDDQTENLRLLCERVLQPVRDHFNQVVSISSGFRDPILSQKIGSSIKSQHCKGEAADFEIFGVSNADLCKWISENCDFDQMILEYHTVGEPNSGWVHVSYRSDGENRKQILRAYRNESKKTCYESYDPSLSLIHI